MCLGLTLRKEPLPEEQSFKAMKTALELGANFWNGGEIYGSPEHNSLQLLNAYFSKHPEDAEKVVISIKGGCTPGGLVNPKSKPDGSPENTRRSIDECLRVLDGKKFLDLFECARVDRNVPVEKTLAVIDEYVKAGKLGGISLSEVSADTIRRAAKVVKVAAVEVEFSLWATDILENGIAKACAELDIPVIAYSPIGRGFLVSTNMNMKPATYAAILTNIQTGQLKKPEDIPEGDFRRSFPRFQGEAFYHNLDLVKSIEQIAKRKGATPAQVGIAWILALSGRNGLPTIIPIPGASSEERVRENTTNVSLTEDELSEIENILKEFTPIGDRYHAAGQASTNG